jgi:hypothetical protein
MIESRVVDPPHVAPFSPGLFALAYHRGVLYQMGIPYRTVIASRC